METVEIPYSIWQDKLMRFETRYPESAETIPRTKVWEGTVPVSVLKAYNDPRDFAHEILEDLFEEFNLNHPEGFEGHSLSVGDIVTVGESAWLCASFGWEPCGYPREEVVTDVV